jgi:sn-glycerol 3-phosphate transport system permease protein
MIENRPLAKVVSHTVLVLGVLVVAFPLLVTLVASTQTPEEIVQQVPMSMWPGSNALETYRVALFGGVTAYGGKVAPVAPMMLVSLISALTISIGKILISLMSAFALVHY